MYQNEFRYYEEVNVFSWFKIFLLKMKEWLGEQKYLENMENYS
jgi:hypothetical protein